MEDKGSVAGYQASFVYRVAGRDLSGTLYPPRTVLFCKSAGRYIDEGHGHRVVVSGAVEPLRGRIFHDDRKPLARWLSSQQRYARVEAEHLQSAPMTSLGRADRIRLAAWPAPLLVLVYTLVIKRCLLDGWPGWFYALQRLLAETMLALELIDHRLAKRASRPGERPC